MARTRLGLLGLFVGLSACSSAERTSFRSGIPGQARSEQGEKGSNENGKAQGANLLAACPDLQPRTSVQLLEDTSFAKGFRINDPVCTKYDGNLGGYNMGNCLEHLPGAAPFPLGVRDPSDSSRFWEVQEGRKKVSGEDYHDHRFAMKAVVTNDDGLGFIATVSTDQGLNRAIHTNGQGWIRLHMNSNHEVNNIATHQGPAFVENTWPTFLLVQTFRDLVSLGAFDEIQITMDVKADTSIAGFDNSGFEHRREELLFYVLLRPNDPKTDKELWFGLMLHSSVPDGYAPIDSVEQNNVRMVRLDSAGFGGRVVAGDPNPRRITFDLKAAMRSQLGADFPFDRYNLASMNWGWENIGRSAVNVELSNLSVAGIAHNASLDGYITAYPKVVEKYGCDPDDIFKHWAHFGYRSGFQVDYRLHPAVLNLDYYLAWNSDLATIHAEDWTLLLKHWLDYGIAHGRIAHPTFHAATYIDKYSDVLQHQGPTTFANNNEKALHHYVTFGLKEGRTAPHPLTVTP